MIKNANTILDNLYEHLKHKSGYSDKTIKKIKTNSEELMWNLESIGLDSLNSLNILHTKKLKEKYLNNKNLAKSTIRDKLSDVQKVYRYLSSTGEYPNITQEMIEYLNFSEPICKANCSKSNKTHLTHQIFDSVYNNLDDCNEISFRTLGIFSLAMLSGARCGALASMLMKSYIPEKQMIVQNPDWGVKTKFGKHIETTFFIFDEKYKRNFDKWYYFLKEVKGFKPEDPLFPMLEVINIGEKATRVIPKFYADAQTLRKLIKDTFKKGGYKNVIPHEIRHLVISLAEEKCQTIRDYKAVSQNVGHTKIEITCENYAQMSADELNAAIKILNTRSADEAKNIANAKFVEQFCKIYEELKDLQNKENK